MKIIILPVMLLVFFQIGCPGDELFESQVDAGADPDGEEEAEFPFCGDGIINGDEECDPGTGLETATCLADCTLPLCLVEKLIYDTGAKTYEYNLNTGEEHLLCERTSGRTFTDVGVSPDGRLYGIHEQLIEIDQETCELETIGNVSPLSSTNSLTFLPDGTALTGSNSSHDVYRITVDPFEMGFWGTIDPFVPAGDYIYINGRIYIATEDSHLLEVEVDASYGFLAMKDLGVMEEVENAYGLSYANGRLWIGTEAGQLFSVYSFEPLGVSLEAEVSERIWGLTSVSESLDCSNI